MLIRTRTFFIDGINGSSVLQENLGRVVVALVGRLVEGCAAVHIPEMVANDRSASALPLATMGLWQE